MAHNPPVRVLLVEDDDAYAAQIAAELGGGPQDVEVHRAGTIADARRQLGSGPFDAILLDLSLPDSQGIETVDRAQAVAAGVPIVVLTAHDDAAAAILAVERGAHDYLVKGQTDMSLLLRAIGYARERAELHHELERRQARFRALVEYSYDAITLLDAELNAVYHSKAIERVVGYPPSEVLGRAYDSLLHDEDRAAVEQHLRECLENPGRAITFEYRFHHKDTSLRWGEAVCVNRLDDPAVEAIVANHRDVTARKTAETALRATEQQLRQAHKMEAIGRLAGGVAHDFNNVLTAIFGYVDLLLDEFDEDDPRRSDLIEIRRSADRAAALTRQLLAFSRKQVVQPRSFDLNTVVRSLEGLLARLVTDDIRVDVRLYPEPVVIRADPGQVEQVLMNLTANARDAMQEGGVLTVETSIVHVGESDPANRPGLAPGVYGMLEVCDSGIGMSESVRAHIFEPFFTTKEAGKGTGLGLATVYGIVKQADGGVYADSREGQGTRFVVYFPRVP